MRTTTLLILIALVALLAAGCGGSGSGDTGEPTGPGSGSERSSNATQSPESVSAADTDLVLEAEDSVNARCGLTEDQEGSDMPVSEAIQIFTAVYTRNPEGIFAAGVSTQPRNMEVIVEDNVRKLRKCGATAEADRLAEALEA